MSDLLSQALGSDPVRVALVVMLIMSVILGLTLRHFLAPKPANNVMPDDMTFSAQWLQRIEAAVRRSHDHATKLTEIVLRLERVEREIQEYNSQFNAHLKDSDAMAERFVKTETVVDNLHSDVERILDSMETVARKIDESSREHRALVERLEERISRAQEKRW